MDAAFLFDGAREASRNLLKISDEKRNEILLSLSGEILGRTPALLDANRRDLERMDPSNPKYDRLKLTPERLQGIAEAMRQVAALPSPLGKERYRFVRPDGLLIRKVSVPFGVIGVIFESRPDALVQISSLCIKSGNGSILKGGSEALRTNKALFDVIYQAGTAAGLPEYFTALIEDRAGISEIIKCSESIDLLIPRGSNAFVKFIMDNSDIPVTGHADGICHVYVDKDADLDKAIPLIIDAKTQYVAACNAAETLLLHKDIAEEVMKRLPGASETAVEYIPAASEEDFREYLDYKMTVKVVEDVREAIAHINHYGSHHTDSIVTENAAAADLFQNLVDSAGVYWNASTRFADGFRYGFGAEVGISTGKMPPRGPVGLDGLVTYKYKLKGNGHIVGDYASGKRSFHFREL